MAENPTLKAHFDKAVRLIERKAEIGADLTEWRKQAKGEVTGSNPVGCANLYKGLEASRGRAGNGLSAECPRNAPAHPPPEKDTAAPVARDGGSDEVKIGTRDYGPAAAGRQQLIAAGRAFVTCHHAALIGLDELKAAGIALDFDLAGELGRIVADLRLIVSGRSSIGALRHAEPQVPEWVREAAAKIAAEQAQRGWRAAA